jgi:Zn-dependent alcohol dehydrogenase
MRAVVWEEAGALGVIEDVVLAPPRAGEALVRVAAAGVCHSDYHLALGHLGRHRFPTVLGHEGAGVVESVGEGVTEVVPGDRVAFCFIPACGVCRQCQRQRFTLCEPASETAFTGRMLDGSVRLSRPDGTELQHFLGIAAFAEQVVTSERALVKLPDGIGLTEAALVGCAVVTGFGAVRNSVRVSPDDRIAVIGCGGVGLQVIAAARLAGADRIVAVDPVPAKQQLALQHGASAALSPDELRGPFDVIFEVVGRTETIELAWRHLDSGGSVVVVGIAPTGVEARIRAIDFSSEKTLRGSFYGSGHPAVEIAELARLVAERTIDLSRTVSHVTDLSGINEAFARMERGEGVRTVVQLENA